MLANTRLRNEGPLQPPPVLEGRAQDVSLRVQSWPGMLAYTHWDRCNSTRVDGAEFHLEQGEFGHIHLNGEIHLALTRPLRDLLIKQRLAEPFVFLDSWVQAPTHSAAEVEQATWLFRLAYDRLRSGDDSAAIKQIEARLTAPV